MSELQEQFTPLDDGRNVRFYEASITKPRSLILLHSEYGDAQANWQKLIPLLAEHYHVLAPDLPGFGKSDPVSEESYQAWLSWLSAFIHSQGLEQEVVLVGASFGALLARLFAAQNPKQVSSLVLINGGTLPGKLGGYKTLLNLPVIGSAVFNGQIKTATSAEGLHATVTQKAILTHEFIANVQANVNGFTAIVGLLMNATPPQNITPETPTMLIWGRENTIVPPVIGQILSRILPDATMFQVADTGHLPHLESVNEIVRQMRNHLD